MKKLFLIASLAFASTFAFSQKKSTPAVSVPADSTITFKLTKPQLEQINKIVTDAAVLISKSNAPFNEAGPLIQNLQAVTAFLKQQSEVKPLPKK